MVSPLLSTPGPLLQSMEPAERLFKHQRRPKWGVGLWVRESKSRRTLVFQDGHVRTFKEGYYGLLAAVDPDEVDVDTLYRQLATEHELALKDRFREEAREERPPIMTFEEQLQVFATLYPGNFTGEAWTEGRRQPAEGGRARKAHMAAASELAQSTLGQQQLATLLEADDTHALQAAMIAVLRHTSMVDLRRDVRPMEELGEHELRQVGHALSHLLWGEARFRNRFSRWLEALRDVGISPTWSLATVFPALVHPTEHVWVKHRAVELQARLLKPGMSLRPKPNRRGYRKARGIVRRVEARLEELGEDSLKHTDQLDVTGFMWDTLRPKGVKTLASLKGGTYSAES